MEELANRLKRCNPENENKLKGHQLEDLEKEVAFKYAKEKGLWIDDIYTLGHHTGISGHENTILLDTENNIIYKSNNLFNSKFLISNLLKKIENHNELFPETKYELVGFTGIEGYNKAPYVEVIIKQDYAKDVIQATSKQIKNFMLNIGFKQTTPQSYANRKYVVFDLYPRNVLIDKNGVFYIIDAEIIKVKDY